MKPCLRHLMTVSGLTMINTMARICLCEENCSSPACGNLFGGWLSDRLVRSHGVKLGRRIIGTAGLALQLAEHLAEQSAPVGG